MKTGDKIGTHYGFAKPDTDAGRYVQPVRTYIDKLPYIYSAVECTRTKEGERKMKQYNGLVQLEVNRLAGLDPKWNM